MESRETMEAAAAEIRRWAPTQSHAVRRAMMDIAKLFSGGWDVRPDNHLYIDTPIRVDEKFVGWARTEISVDANGEIHVKGEFEPVEDGS